MAEEFEGDLAGAVFWGADLRDATFRDVDLTGARISHAFVVDVDIDAQVERLVVNGVDVMRSNAGVSHGDACRLDLPSPQRILDALRMDPT